jgi:transposase-like protein
LRGKATPRRIPRFRRPWGKDPPAPALSLSESEIQKTISLLSRFAKHNSSFTPRKIIYTTNAVKSLNMSLRRVRKTRGAFPSEEAALKVMYLALRKWECPQHWRAALNRFTLPWEERIQAARQA